RDHPSGRSFTPEKSENEAAAGPDQAPDAAGEFIYDRSFTLTSHNPPLNPTRYRQEKNIGPTVHARVPQDQQPGGPQTDELRRRLQTYEPHSLRTFTPSLAVIARSEGSYHFTPEGRKLADFTSGVLVANLGHNPTRWWKRLLDYLHLNVAAATGPYVSAVP